MKKIFSMFVAVLMLSSIVSSVIAQTISQPVTGSFILDDDFLALLQEKNTLLFGDPGVDLVVEDTAVRSDVFEATVDATVYGGPVLACPGAGGADCDLIQNIRTAYTSASRSTSEEDDLTVKAFDHMFECALTLEEIYSGPSLTVGAQTYFNDVKLNYVCMIKNLGILEQMIVDEPGAFFLLQMLQQIEVDYQHLLAIEDDKAAFAFSVGPPTITGPPAVANPLDSLEIAITDGEGPGTSNYFFDVTDLDNTNLEDPAIAVVTIFTEDGPASSAVFDSLGNAVFLLSSTTRTTSVGTQENFILKLSPGTTSRQWRISTGALNTQQVVVAQVLSQSGNEILGTGLSDNLEVRTGGVSTEPPDVGAIGVGSFTRDDNADMDEIRLSDPIVMLHYLFTAGPSPGAAYNCIADNDADGTVVTPEDPSQTVTAVGTFPLTGLIVQCDMVTKIFKNDDADDITLEDIESAFDEIMGVASIIPGDSDGSPVSNFQFYGDQAFVAPTLQGDFSVTVTNIGPDTVEVQVEQTNNLPGEPFTDGTKLGYNLFSDPIAIEVSFPSGLPADVIQTSPVKERSTLNIDGFSGSVVIKEGASDPAIFTMTLGGGAFFGGMFGLETTTDTINDELQLGTTLTAWFQDSNAVDNPLSTGTTDIGIPNTDTAFGISYVGNTITFKTEPHYGATGAYLEVCIASPAGTLFDNPTTSDTASIGPLSTIPLVTGLQLFPGLQLDCFSTFKTHSSILTRNTVDILVSPPAQTMVGAFAAAQVNDDMDTGNYNVMGDSSGASSALSIPTGAFSALPEGQGSTAALVITAIVVIGAFLFILRKKQV